MTQKYSQSVPKKFKLNISMMFDERSISEEKLYEIANNLKKLLLEKVVAKVPHTYIKVDLTRE